MMIYQGLVVPHTRPNSSKNKFRALCLINNKVAIVDTKDVTNFGNFISKLLNIRAMHALYLDMGNGWNYSWYRDEKGNTIEIHPIPTKFATNWITFYNTK